MIFYPSKNHDRLNALPFAPETVNGCVMLNPKYKVRSLAPNTRAIIDSGAFQDIHAHQRLTPADALARQLELEATLEKQQPQAWHAEAIVTYDQMLGVDEHIDERGRKVKRRGTVDTARAAIEETLYAAEYYAANRTGIRGHLAFAAQGASPQQYVEECVVPLLRLMKPTDWFAFGGFCIVGRQPSLKPVLYETVEHVLPLLQQHGITRAHLLGITVCDAIVRCEQLAQAHGITLSTDSSSIEVNSVIGKSFRSKEGRWVKAFYPADKFTYYHPCSLAMENIRRYNLWCQRVTCNPHTHGRFAGIDDGAVHYGCNTRDGSCRQAYSASLVAV